MAYIESIILGISFAAIPGPIFFEVLRRTLQKGFWDGAMLAVGEFLANFVILMLIFFGISSFLFYTPVKMALFLSGGIILIYLGIAAFKLKKENIKETTNKDYSKNNSVLVGFLLAMSSPLAIAVWISVGGAYLVQYTSRSVSFANILLLATGVLIFFFGLASIIHLTRKRISGKVILIFSKIFGSVLVAYGLYFLFQFFQLIAL